VGQEIKCDLFSEGQFVDVTGTSKGKGYAGVMKRYGFAGFPATHGTHEYFRHGGSIGQKEFPAKVWKNKKMPGQMGNERVTTLSLRVVRVDAEQDVVMIRGSVPGSRNGTVILRPAVKKG
jgi:large subunit ribosomal protein L3